MKKCELITEIVNAIVKSNPILKIYMTSTVPTTFPRLPRQTNGLKK